MIENNIFEVLLMFKQSLIFCSCCLWGLSGAVYAATSMVEERPALQTFARSEFQHQGSTTLSSGQRVTSKLDTLTVQKKQEENNLFPPKESSTLSLKPDQDLASMLNALTALKKSEEDKPKSNPRLVEELKKLGGISWDGEIILTSSLVESIKKMVGEHNMRPFHLKVGPEIIYLGA